MLSAFREPKNIPISISLLHDIEYKNICLMYSLNFKQIEKRRAFTTMFNVGEALQGYAKLEALAQSNHHIIPGHDPLVMHRYPAASPAMTGIVARLDMEPQYG